MIMYLFDDYLLCYLVVIQSEDPWSNLNNIMYAAWECSPSEYFYKTCMCILV